MVSRSDERPNLHRKWSKAEDKFLMAKDGSMSILDIAITLGRSLNAVHGRRQVLGLRNGNDERPIYEPTPEEIAAECAKIQGTWGDRERQSRALWAANGEAMPPAVRMGSRQGESFAMDAELIQ